MRIIDADALKKAINDNGYSHYFEIFDIIDNAPTVDITFKEVIAYECGQKSVERPTGHWIIEECSLGKTYYCSECYAHPEVCFDFCPYCGADMRGEDK